MLSYVNYVILCDIVMCALVLFYRQYKKNIWMDTKFCKGLQMPVVCVRVLKAQPPSLGAADHFNVATLGANARLFHGVAVEHGGDAHGDEDQRDHDADAHPEHGERAPAQAQEVRHHARSDLQIPRHPRHTHTRDTGGRAPGVTALSCRRGNEQHNNKTHDM